MSSQFGFLILFCASHLHTILPPQFIPSALLRRGKRRAQKWKKERQPSIKRLSDKLVKEAVTIDFIFFFAVGNYRYHYIIKINLLLSFL